MTVRTLVIMRHAKAEQDESLADIDRPLTTRGRDDATAAGRWLAAAGIRPDLVMCSPSIRTRSTWHALAIGFAEEPGAASPTVRYESDLYHGGLSAAMKLIRGVDPDLTTLVIIGHNPTVSALSTRLDDRTIRPAGGMRTAGLAIHDVTTSWADCAAAPLRQSHTARR